MTGEGPVAGWRRLRVRMAVLAGLMLALAAGGAARGAVQLAQIGRFDDPVDVTAPEGDTARVFVVQRGGVIKVVNAGRISTYLDLTSKVISSGQEQGLF